ncbi:cytochrome P450 9e2-like [Periplaneta americana]|uniref:cytochrome P450 9e2-like n=1 Tax=Periplaneta americana TaxID=6978 RepID=UPI0037E78385
MMFLDTWWPVVTAVGCILFYLYLTWTHDYWRKKGVPYLEPKLIFGNLKDTIIGRTTIGECVRESYLQLEGYKLGGLFKMRQPVLLLRDPELIKTVMIKDFSNFQDNDIHVNVETDPLLGRNPFLLPGEIWKDQRARLTPGFTSVKLKQMYPLIQEVCNDLVEHLEENVAAGNLLETKTVATKFAADSVAYCAYGLRQNSFKNPDTEFRKYGRMFLEPTFWKSVEQAILTLTPALADFLRLKFAPTEVTNFFRRMTKETAVYRKENNIKRNDYLQMLIQIMEKYEDTNNSEDKSISWYKKFTYEDIAAQALTFFTDGYETSSTALAVALYNLACNPEVQQRLHEEIDSVTEKHNGDISFEALQEMTYLDMFIDESLRLYPQVSVLSKLCTKPHQLPLSDGKSFTVDVGTPVIIPVLAIHHDPKYYPDPKRFDPLRFTDEEKAKRPKCTYLPFGEGPRICLGRRFALLQNKACIANIIANYEVHKCEETPQQLTGVPMFIIFSPKEEIWVKIVKRTDK